MSTPAERKREYNKRYYEKTAEQQRAYAAAYRAAHPEAQETVRRWQLENPEKARAAAYRWQKANRDRHLENVILGGHSRRARRAGVLDDLTREDLHDLYKEPVCKACGSTENLSVDHILAIANRGPNTRTNVQLLCKPCNSKKGAR